MKNTYLFIVVIFAFFAISQTKATAQTSQGEVLDRIVAIVGNEIIMHSDVQGYIAQFSMQDPTFDSKDPDVYQKVLDALINEKLVITKAIEDSITVTDDEITQRWDFQIQRLVQRYGSEKRIEDIYGISIARMKREFFEDIRKQLLSEKIKAKQFSEVKVTPREVREFFEKYKDSIPKIPAQVELYHIVKNVKPNLSSKEEIFLLARSVRDSILRGGDFADFAKRYSGDPGTANAGGELGWTSRGRFFREFEEAAFSLQKGAISQPVETPFGLHIIQTLDRVRDSIRTRHILFRFGQTAEDTEAAKELLSDLRKKAIEGEDFEELARRFSDERETQAFGGLLGKFPIDQIPANLKGVIDNIEVGGISEPLLYSSEPRRSFHIIFKKRFIPEHDANLEEDLKQIEQMAIAYKQTSLYNDWIEKLRKEMYWEIK